jgi:hypothetical protein
MNTKKMILLGIFGVAGTVGVQNACDASSRPPYEYKAGITHCTRKRVYPMIVAVRRWQGWPQVDPDAEARREGRMEALENVPPQLNALQDYVVAENIPVVEGEVRMAAENYANGERMDIDGFAAGEEERDQIHQNVRNEILVQAAFELHPDSEIQMRAQFQEMVSQRIAELDAQTENNKAEWIAACRANHDARGEQLELELVGILERHEREFQEQFEAATAEFQEICDQGIREAKGQRDELETWIVNQYSTRLAKGELQAELEPHLRKELKQLDAIYNLDVQSYKACFEEQCRQAQVDQENELGQYITQLTEECDIFFRVQEVILRQLEVLNAQVAAVNLGEEVDQQADEVYQRVYAVYQQAIADDPRLAANEELTRMAQFTAGRAWQAVVGVLEQAPGVAIAACQEVAGRVMYEVNDEQIAIVAGEAGGEMAFRQTTEGIVREAGNDVLGRMQGVTQGSRLQLLGRIAWGITKWAAFGALAGGIVGVGGGFFYSGEMGINSFITSGIVGRLMSMGGVAGGAIGLINSIFRR